MKCLKQIINILYALTMIKKKICFDDISFNNKENIYVYEQKLIDHIFADYNSKVKPPGTVQITMAFNLLQIIDIIEKQQILILNAFIDHYWQDSRLKWEPDKFGNISMLRISSTNIWMPDTFIYTCDDNNALVRPSSRLNILLDNNGNVFWPTPLYRLRIRCKMNVAWFAFDDQLCVIVFGSWSFSQKLLNYTYKLDGTSLKSYLENNVWNVIDFKPSRQETTYDAWVESDSFSEINYKLLVRRKPLFAIQNFVIPAAMLCVLTLIAFFIPFASTMQIGISIMLTFAVFKLRLASDLPQQSDKVPLISIYFILCMLLSLSAMIWFSAKNYLIENKMAPKFMWYIVRQNIQMNKSCKSNFNKKGITNINNKDFEKNLLQNKTSSLKRGEAASNLKLDKIDCSSIKTEKYNDLNLTYVDVIQIFNILMFTLFFILAIFLHIFSLYFLPYFVKESLSLD